MLFWCFMCLIVLHTQQLHNRACVLAIFTTVLPSSSCATPPNHIIHKNLLGQCCLWSFLQLQVLSSWFVMQLNACEQAYAQRQLCFSPSSCHAALCVPAGCFCTRAHRAAGWADWEHAKHLQAATGLHQSRSTFLPLTYTCKFTSTQNWAHQHKTGQNNSSASGRSCKIWIKVFGVQLMSNNPSNTVFYHTCVNDAFSL